MRRQKPVAAQSKQPQKQAVELKFTPRAVRTIGDLSSTLITARLCQGLTQKEVAQRIGVSQSAVSLFEKRGSDLQFSTLMRILHSMGMEMTVSQQKESPPDAFEGGLS